MVDLLVPVRTTTNVDRARKAVIANATVVRPLVSVRPMTSVTSERIVVGEFVWSGGAILGTIIIFAIIIFIVFCRCCACCP